MHLLHHATGPNTLIDRTLPLDVPQVARMETQVQAPHHKVMEIGGEARNGMVRILPTHEEQEHRTDAMLNLQVDQEKQYKLPPLLRGGDGRPKTTNPCG